MRNQRVLHRSFTGGEVSPEMFGRLDDAKYQTGAEQVQNMLVKPHGPVMRRPGFGFVSAIKDSTRRVRLIPFVYAQDQSMVLELSRATVDGRDIGYIRFHTSGGTLLYSTPSAYITPQSIDLSTSGSFTLGIDTAADQIRFASAHGLTTNDLIVFTLAGGASLPAPLGAGVAYAAIVVSSTVIQVSATIGGSAIDLTTTGSGDRKMHRRYMVGELVQWSGVGPGSFYCMQEPWHDHTDHPPTDLSYWVRLPAVDGSGLGIYEVPHQYAEADLFDIQYVQSLDVMTLTHQSRPPSELRRLGATYWTLQTISFTKAAAPTGVTASAFHGKSMRVTACTAVTPTVLTTSNNHLLTEGLGVYVQNVGTVTDGFYVVGVTTPNTLKLKDVQTGDDVGSASTTLGAAPRVIPTSLSSVLTFDYVVTAVASDGSESIQSAAATVQNNLNADGAYNTVSWSAVSGAARYRVYRKQSGIYGYVGSVDASLATSFEDHDIAPNLGITPPIADNGFVTGDYPGACGYFEQRRVFAGTPAHPQSVWMTRTATESDMSYTLPSQDTNRLLFTIAARESSTVRHVVPVGHLVLLTSSAEYRVSPVNQDALTPSSVSVRPQTYIGASKAQPSVVNNTIVFGAARGGHVHALAYRFDAGGFVGSDLSLRSEHLFEGHTIQQFAVARAPIPTIWAVRDDGVLLGLTFVPDQDVLGWHRHVTAGQIESVAVVPEQDEDRVYVAVLRQINGTQARYIERMGQVLNDDIPLRVDASLEFNGNNATSLTITLSAGGSWGVGESLTLTASGNVFVTGSPSPDIGDEIQIGGVRVRITAVASTTSATGVIVGTSVDPAVRGVPTTVWAWARTSFAGLDHLEGQGVSYLADGQVGSGMVTAGTLSLSSAVIRLQVGLAYTSRLLTLPLALQVDGAFGYGRNKNINRVWVRTLDAQQFQTGPHGGTQITVDTTTEDLQNLVVPGDWDNQGQLEITTDLPLPLTVVAVAMEVAAGG